MSPSQVLFVADVGNSTIDIGEFAYTDLTSDVLPSPQRTTKVSLREFMAKPSQGFEDDWLRDLCGSRWLIGSVNQTGATQLDRWLYECQADSVRFLNHKDFEISTAIRNRHAVGIDRLAAATAANRIRSPERPTIIVDAGTAITVDCVSHEGVFLGGMIAPGLQLCAEALGKKTEQLPTLLLPDSRTPQLIGDDTKTAIESGAFWLVAAGVDGILDRLKRELAGSCDLFVTGGSMPRLLSHLNRHAPEHVPSLVLSGLAMTMMRE